MTWMRLLCMSAILLVVTLTSACAIPGPGAASPGKDTSAPTSTPWVSYAHPLRVTITGGTLHLDGRPWWPTGFNAYQLATDWTVNAGCGAMVDLDSYFSSRQPGTVTRFNAFQNLAVDKRNGKLNFEPIDAVFAAAERHRQLLIPVLAAQDGACEDEQYKTREWYLNGWQEPTDMPLSYSEWVAAAVDRWAGSPSIAAWELLGEPEVGVCTIPDCDLHQRRCPEDSPQVLRDWVDAAGAVARAHDRRHLLTLGLLGGEQCGLADGGYTLVAASPYLDVVQYHDYDDAAFLPLRLEQTEKPVLVTEFGVRAGNCMPLTERATRIGAQIDRYYTMGAAGALLWAFVPDPRPHECTYDIGPFDPIHGLPQLR